MLEIMGMSTYVVGFIPPDEQWKKIKAAYDALVAAGIDIPQEIYRVLGDEPSDHGKEVSIPSKEWCDDYRDGFDITLSELDPNIKIIRFYNSYLKK